MYPFATVKNRKIHSSLCFNVCRIDHIFITVSWISLQTTFLNLTKKVVPKDTNLTVTERWLNIVFTTAKYLQRTRTQKELFIPKINYLIEHGEKKYIIRAIKKTNFSQ